MTTAALIPVKRFADAKGRLRGVLDDEHRVALAARLAGGVIAACGEVPVFVACDDDEIAEWAQRRGATVVWTPDRGLNGAVDDGITDVRRAGFSQVVVAHADLVSPLGITAAVRPGWVTLVPDRRNDGTNVMSLPLDGPALAASYGGGSFRRHLACALDLGLAVEVRRDPLLALDIDTPADLRHPVSVAQLPDDTLLPRDER